ncbi:MAG: family 1 encapsulin nanocompartment shell protein [Senegalia sp. (in: firmicutes)]|uniref:family 1 encapsulin nanocompartment shell protein n=1 Tax=Senegalia sp. (in: firmicutes) TaxID=1924098 RepID=UPI003F9A31CD
MLKRNLAPISEAMWEEIDDRAKEVLSNYLSARKVVNVSGPKGLEYNAISEGRLETIEGEEDVCAGIYKVKPLIESRVEFELNRWEMDNLERGAKDIELDNLEEAAKKIALFEDKAIYNGFRNGMIEGLTEASGQEKMSFGNSGDDIIKSVSKAIIKLNRSFTSKPYALVVGEEAYERINANCMGYPLIKRLEDLLGMEVIYSHVVKGAFLVPFDHEDLEMTIGKDLSIGYQSSDNEKVRFFMTESFTFRVLDPDIIIEFTV